MSDRKQRYFRLPWQRQKRLSPRALYRMLLRELPAQEALCDRRLKRQEIKKALRHVIATMH